MKKKLKFLIGFIMMLGIVVGCTENVKSFDDKNLLFKVVDSQTNNELKSNIIEITNETGFDLDNLSLKISYPLHTSNDKSERKIVESIKKFRIKSNESKEISISIPIETDTTSLEIDVKGDVMIDKDKEMPFEIGGTLKTLTDIP